MALYENFIAAIFKREKSPAKFTLRTVLVHSRLPKVFYKNVIAIFAFLVALIGKWREIKSQCRKFRKLKSFRLFQILIFLLLHI
jgi:hypothetical protein